MARLRAGIIGCGAAARIAHGRWYLVNPDVELVALADPDAGALKDCAERYSVSRTYTDPLEMLEKEKLDLVSICSPPHVHAEQASRAAEAGANVLCEKPMARTLEECGSMIDSARRHGTKLMIAFHKRHNIGFIKVSELIQKGEVGRAHAAFAHLNSFPDPTQRRFRFLAYTGGGVFQDHGSHYADVFRWWLGSVESVVGEISIVFPETHEVEDHAVATLRFTNGGMASIETSWAAPGGVHRTLVGDEPVEEGQVYGTDGSLSFSIPPWTHFEAPDIELWRRKPNERIKVPLSVDMLDFTHYHYKRQIDYFVKCTKEDKAPIPSGEDGRAAIEVVVGLYESWWTGRRVKLPLERTPPVDEILRELRRACSRP